MQIPNKAHLLGGSNSGYDDLEHMPDLVISKGYFSLCPIRDMILKGIVEVLPILDGFISGTAGGTPFFSLQFEPVEGEQIRTFFILYLLEKIVQSRVGGDSFKPHEKSHRQ